ncbi:MAG TPA: serine hydrolase [bacterium]|nr:serine hydrolase [bacterium]
MKQLTIVFSLIALSIGCAAAETSTLVPEPVQAEIQRRLDADKYTGLAIGIVDSDGTHYCFYGKKQQDPPDPPDADTMYEIGSITKVFTAILLADQCRRTDLTLDDPIRKYLPPGTSVPTRNGKEITLKHLVTHTSGLPRMPDNFKPADPRNPFADYSTEMMLAFLSNCTLERDIGAEVAYSNFGVGLLGYILEQVTGQSYETLVKERITGPLGMTHTGIHLSPEMKKSLAPGYAYGMAVPNWDIVSLAGAGALRSSVRDMCRFIAANMGLYETDLLPILQQTHQPVKALPIPDMEVGLAWHIRSKDDVRVIWHNGGTGGYRSFAGFLAGGNRGVVVLGNSAESVDDIGFHLLFSGFELKETQPAASVTLKKYMAEKPPADAIAAFKTFWETHKEALEYSEHRINLLGYRYMENGEMDKALAVFQLNTEMSPDSANVWDSLGEAWKNKGQKEKSIAAYTEALKRNPKMASARKMLTELGVNPDDVIPKVTVPAEILKKYVGEYELAPGFTITIRLEGDQLIQQATGQDAYPIFPASETRFYLKVVDAQMAFHTDDTGAVTGMTLYQGGQELPGKKIK